MKLKYYKSKAIKNIIHQCEIEGCTISDPSILECHHIIPQSEKDTNKDFSHGFYNLAILCPTHHRMVELGEIIIEGRVKTTNGTMLIYKLSPTIPL